MYELIAVVWDVCLHIRARAHVSAYTRGCVCARTDTQAYLIYMRVCVHCV